MNDPESDAGLESAVNFASHEGRRVPIDPGHRIRLREELQRRHQQLLAEDTQRAAGKLVPQMALRRLPLVAPPALLAAVALAVAVWMYQTSSSQSTRSVEAAKISAALSQSVPTVSGWGVSVRRLKTDSVLSYQCAAPLRKGQRLVMRGDNAYLYSAGTWYHVTAVSSGSACSRDLRWAFAVLPKRLASHSFTLLGHSTVRTQFVAMRFSMQKGADLKELATAWITRRTGLVRRLRITVFRDGHKIETDVADYRYQRSHA